MCIGLIRSWRHMTELIREQESHIPCCRSTSFPGSITQLNSPLLCRGKASGPFLVPISNRVTEAVYRRARVVRLVVALIGGAQVSDWNMAIPRP
jgi:hypothetical protein